MPAWCWRGYPAHQPGHHTGGWDINTKENKTTMRRILAGMAAGATAVLALATPAQADDAKLSASAQTECGKVTVTFVNNTANLYSADIRVDDEPGVDDQFTSLGNITGGPNDGKPYGQRYQKVAVPAGQTVAQEVTFPEDSGKHKVAYRIWRGPETDYYVDWQTASVDTDCEPSQPPASNPPASTAPDQPKDCEAYVYAGTKQSLCDRFADAADDMDCKDIKWRVRLLGDEDPWKLDDDRDGVGCEANRLKPTDDPAPPAAGAGGGQSAGSLPVTGASVPVLGGVAALLLVGGGAAMVVSRRRRTRFTA